MASSARPDIDDAEDDLAAGMSRLATVAGGCAVLFGGLVATGWMLKVHGLAIPVPDRPVMMPNTAAAFVLAGITLILRQPARPGRTRLVAGLTGAWLLVLFAVAVMAEHLFDISLGIDQLIAAAPAGVPGGAPGRTAFDTAIAFLLIGLAIVVLEVRSVRGVRPSQVLALGTVAFGVISLTGRLYSAPHPAGIVHLGPFLAMSMSTSALFLIVGLGVLFLRPREGIMGIVTNKHLGGLVVRRLIQGSFLIPVIIVLVEHAQRRGWLNQAMSSTLIFCVTMVVILALILLTGKNLNILDAERRAHADELRRWKHFFDHAQFGAAFGANDMTMQLVNDSFATMHGMTREECVGRPVLDIVAPADRAQTARHMVQVHALGHLRFDSEHLRKDGTTFPVEVDATAVKGPSGEVLYRAVLVQDITQRRLAEEARSQLAAIVDASDDGIFSMTLDGTVLTWNQGAARMTGYSAEEILGRPISLFSPAGQQPELRARLERLRRGERIPVYEGTRLRKDGSLVPLLIAMSPILGAAGQPTAISCIAHDISDRKAMEESLRRSEARSRQLFMEASDAIFLFDAEGHYTDVNASGCQLMDCSRDEIIGRSIGDFVPAEEVPGVFAGLESILKGNLVAGEWHARRPSGALVPVEVRSKLLPDGRLQAFVRDITSRKEVERILRAVGDEEKRLREVLEALSGAERDMDEVLARLPAVDIKELFEVIVTQAEALTHARYVALGVGDDPDRPCDRWVTRGMTPEEVAVLARTPGPEGFLSRLMPPGLSLPDQRQDRRFLVVAIRYQGRARGTLYLVDKRDGSDFTDEDRRVVVILAERAGLAIETATLSARAEMQRGWLQSIVDHLPEATVVADAEGHFIAQSRSAAPLQSQSMSGPDRWGNATTIDLRDPRTLEPLDPSDHPLTRALERGEETVRRELLVCGEGHRILPAQVNVAVMRDPAGKEIGAIMSVQDVTALKELDRLREEWMSIVGHDLRQPVSVIGMSVELLRRTVAQTIPDPRITLTLDRINSASMRLARMIGDLLDASRLEAHHLKLEKKTFDLRQQVETIIERLSGTFEAHSIRVVAPPGPVPLTADPDRIEQVLINLLSNAVKYGDPGTEIVIEIRSSDEQAGLTVTNSGHGIGPEQLPRIFSRFERAWAPRETRTPGIGLGLYICKGLIDAHAGHIWVESTPGKTTTFGFELPKRPASSELDVAETSESTTATRGSEGEAATPI